MVPTLNEADNLPVLLDSLSIQDRLADEVLIVDGGSTDGTQGIVEDSCVARLIEAPGTTMGGAMDIGVREASGDVVAKTDGDAFVPDNWISRIVYNFETFPEVAIVGGMAVSTRTPHRVLNPVFNHVLGMAGEVGAAFIGCNLAVRRDAVLDVGGWPDINMGEDHLITRRITRRYPWRFDPELKVYMDFDTTLGEWLSRAVERGELGRVFDDFVDWVL